MDRRKLLKFGRGNAKLKEDIATYRLPSGWTCPGARDCLARADRDTGRIWDGPHQKHRCYAATEESRPSVRAAGWHNRLLLQEAARAHAHASLGMEGLILASLPRVLIQRVHTGGDFYSQDYFDAWLRTAQTYPQVTFYAYTKSTDLVMERAEEVLAQDNFVITGSRGGEFDHITDVLLDGGVIGEAHVVNHPDEAEELGLEIDHDDSHAILGADSFALLLHGTQPKGSEAAEARKVLVRDGIRHSYSKKG